MLGKADRPPVLARARAATAYAALALDPVQAGIRLHARYGPAFVIDPPLKRRNRRRRGLFVAREALAEQVLEHIDQFHSMGLSPVRGPSKSAQRRLRDGMIRMNGAEQVKLRRAYGPGLSNRKICAQTERLEQIAREEIAAWPRETMFDAMAPVKRIVRRAASAMLFGADDDPEILAIADMLEQHARLQFDLVSLVARVAIPGLPYHRLLRQAELTEATLVDWIGRREKGGDDLVSRIANACGEDGAPLDVRAQAAQFWTLYGASFHTTATAIHWALLHLAWNPEASRRLAEELDASGEESPFLDAVINEVLRLSPPVPYQIRRSAADGRIGEMDVSAGDRVFISSQVMNRDPAVYEKPNSFLPERWLAIPGTAYRPLAFSAGPRRCLGYTFAIAVIKATLVEIWRAGRIGVENGARIGVRLAITQGPTKLPLILWPRAGRVAAAHFTGAAALQMSVVDQKQNYGRRSFDRVALKNVS